MAVVISRNDPAFDEALLDRASVAFGVFDGVHEGHRFIIGEAVNTAREEGRASAVITFDIDPDEVFAADRLKKLMTNEARIAKLAELDVDAVVVLPFSREFAAQSPEDFLNACFGGGVPSHIHIGSDFHFGRKAAGNVESLRAWGAERGMEVHGHELVAEGGRPVTATRIRGLLSEGRAREAATVWGAPILWREPCARAAARAATSASPRRIWRCRRSFWPSERASTPATPWWTASATRPP